MAIPERKAWYSNADDGYVGYQVFGSAPCHVHGPPNRATCAPRLRSELARLGIPIRVGIHTGEIEVRADEVGGIGVHIASRVIDHAREDSVVASSTVRDLVVGSGFDFEKFGTYALKGVAGVESLRGDRVQMTRTTHAAQPIDGYRRGNEETV